MSPRRRGFHHVVHAKAPVEVVFDVLADGARWSEWGRPIVLRSSWDRQGDPAPGGVGAVRKVGAPPLFVREEITEYDRPHRIGYTIASGLPVRDYHAVVKLVPEGDGTRIEWSGAFVTAIPVAADVLAPLFGLSVLAIARRAAKHAENLVSRRP